MAFDLDILIAEYLEDVGGQPPVRWRERRREWNPDILHVSDLSACPRAVGLRLRGEPQEPRPPQDYRKFVLANFQHELIYLALDWAGKLVEAEVPVPMPDGWEGTADMILDDFYDEEWRDGVVVVADSKNPVAGAAKYAATYPKPEDIMQVSVYSAFLRASYPALANEGQVFYLPLGGASMWLPTRFPLVPEDEVRRRMAELEAVRETLPDPLPLGISWYKRRFYTRSDGSQTVTGDLYYSTDWRCRYCLFLCPNREQDGKKLCRVSSKGIGELTSLGRKMLDQIEMFLLDDANG